MDETKYLILFKGKDCTRDIKFCQRVDSRYRIQFHNNSVVYTPSADLVEYYENPQVLSPEKIRISRNGKQILSDACSYDFGFYIRIASKGNPYLSLHKKSEVTIEYSFLDKGNAAECLKYFSRVADIVGLKNSNQDSILKLQYDELKFVGEHSALAKYLSPADVLNALCDDTPIIFPFGFNLSQKEAVEKAFQNQISLIEGPPGTGKTQTILNIIANALLRGKTVAVVSNNNSPTQNVQEKLEKYNLSFIGAFLGNKDNKNNFISEQSGVYPDMTSWKVENESLSQTQRKLSELAKDLDDKLKVQNKVAFAKQQLSDIKLEAAYFYEYYHNIENHLPLSRKKGFSVLQSNNLLDLWLKCEMFSPKRRRAPFWFSFMSRLRYGQFDLAFYKSPLNDIITEFQKQYYDLRIQELENEIKFQEEILLEFHFPEKMQEHTHCSMELLKATLFEKYKGRKSRPVFTDEVFWKNASDFLDQYPLILSTTESLIKSLENVTYDYLIIDEASQVDVVKGALALSCAKNLVVVGDLKQLPNIVPDKVAKVTQAIFREFQLPQEYEYSSNSLLSSIGSLFPNIPKTLLREHYRCHPRIIDFCNRKFYNGQLIIMTKDNGESDVLKTYRTVEGNHARGRYNQRQIDVILNEVLPNLGADISGNDIGVISPYREQTNAVSEQLGDTGIEVETVHKYQGREKENIIITTVDNQISKFVDKPDMLNVAISRAEKRLRVVVSGNEGNENTNIGDLVKYMQYHNYEVIDSKICSVFDLLYKQYSQRRELNFANKKRIFEYPSEELLDSIIRRVLSKNEFAKLKVYYHYPLRLLLKKVSELSKDEIVYVTNPNTHVDFLIYDNMDKKPILTVEVDGYAFHKPGTRQHERDIMKNKILKQAGIPILRLMTNESNEECRLIKMLQQALG
ncbi:MAG: AAA domain-containing protein [Clostridium sp.]|uniref:AAA domain-containing protein n=1 Tax=Clostridium sp. TaxID=1506 RepID=UPI00290E697A|nr:AAA domain-containing protein [Clostridium sp.]MDU7337818.1 AAA domain-containing protein [Clostridium sp.]